MPKPSKCGVIWCVSMPLSSARKCVSCRGWWWWHLKKILVVPQSIFFPAAAVNWYLTMNGSPTDYRNARSRQSIVQFSARFRPGAACVGAPPTRRGANSLSSVTVTNFCFSLHVIDVSGLILVTICRRRVVLEGPVREG